MNTEPTQPESRHEEERHQRVKAHLEQILSEIRPVGSLLAQTVNQPELRAGLDGLPGPPGDTE
ncbi:MAG: hypothetical protein H7Y88_09575 [Phycisphaerales bacterium]|nr:hypothetical protein [Phycisphaerales bacterium]